MNQVLPLHLLRSGEGGEVIDVCGNEQMVARLAESGLRKGSRLEVLSSGNPLLLRVDQTKLSLRSDGTVEILVHLLASSA